jgi:hypothetical protein
LGLANFLFLVQEQNILNKRKLLKKFPVNCYGKDKLKEDILTEKCWKGYTQKGMKTMFGKKYPNCVKIK